MRIRVMFAVMSSFLVSGPGSRCINSHCEGYPKTNIKPYTKGTANRESADMLMEETCKVEKGRRGRAPEHVIGSSLHA